MLVRPEKEWHDYRHAMEAVDYNNTTGWRHQHSGVRLQFETLWDDCMPDWRVIASSSLDSWVRVKKRFVQNVCDHLHIYCPSGAR
eukprot:8583036-Karenia_brevis.AAC.1